jgi:hypothetical protein
LLFGSRVAVLLPVAQLAIIGESQGGDWGPWQLTKE